MNDVKKTWCAPAWLLDPERLERQLDRLSAEGWQLEGTGWLSFRYRRGAPNEYRYRVQYLYESRDGQRDDYVRGLAELGVELVMDIGSFLILRRRNDGTPFELFSDLDSRITSEKRYLRTRGLLAAFWLVLAAGPLRRAAVWYGCILEYAADLTAESGIDLPRLWAEGILTDALLGLLWASAFSGRRTAPRSGSAGCGRRGLSKNKRSAAPASCVSLCDFYRISMRECRGANGKNRLPFRGKRL